ncbi:MAG: SMI1/KNR4 family protein [Elusimicrobiales bacterium]|nr:SMI1/KNR4 family protein [Elusimicrobiales bacterium]
MKWKYVKKTTIQNINKVEELYCVQLTDRFKNFILDFNNGRPEFDTFDTDIEQGREFKKILSYNPEDIENIYDYVSIFKGTALFPFGTDPSGNFLCLKDNRIVLLNHETEEIEYVADSMEEFINRLY